MGRNDYNRNHIWCIHRKNARYHECSSGFCKRCSNLVYYNGGSDGILEHQANQYITTNFIANFLGLGWAATPAGLQGMQALAELEQERRMKRAPGKARKPGVASNEMCTFLIMNISSLQLIPINVIAYRSQYGSVNPAAIVGAGIVATTVSTLAGMVYCKIMDRKR